MGKPAKLVVEEPCAPPRDGLVRVRCTFCHDGLERDQAVFCASCLAPHHAECHSVHGRCAGPGCEEPLTVRPEERAPRRRRTRLAALACVLLLAAGLGAWGLSDQAPKTSARAPAAPPAPKPPAPEPPAPEPEPPSSATQAPPDRLEAAGLELVTRGFNYPVQLEPGEQLGLHVEEAGFVHVHLVPAKEQPSWHRARAVMVVEPGDPIELRGPHCRRRVVPTPEEAVVIAADSDGAIRVSRLRMREE